MALYGNVKEIYNVNKNKEPQVKNQGGGFDPLDDLFDSSTGVNKRRKQKKDKTKLMTATGGDKL